MNARSLVTARPYRCSPEAIANGAEPGRIRRAALRAAALLALALSAVHEAPGEPAPVDPFARTTTPVAEHIWLIYRSYSSTEAPFEGNVEIFEQADGLVVVDSGGSPLSGQHIVAGIRKLSSKRVKFLVYTHYHGDHNLGAGAIRSAWPDVVIISTVATRDNMTGPPMSYVKTYGRDYQGMVDHARQEVVKEGLSDSKRNGWQHIVDVGPAMVAAYGQLNTYPANLTFSSRLEIPDEAVPVEVMFLGRANTDGDAVVWAPRQRVVATGDIVVNPVPYASASYPAEWIKVLEAIRSFHFTALIPGHGRVLRDSSYLDRLEGALAEVRAQVGPLAVQGLALEAVRAQVHLDDVVTSFAGADEWERAMCRIFFLNALVSNAYKESRGESIIQGHDGG